jgi:hypothetical protein
MGVGKRGREKRKGDVGKGRRKKKEKRQKGERERRRWGERTEAMVWPKC